MNLLKKGGDETRNKGDKKPTLKYKPVNIMLDAYDYNQWYEEEWDDSTVKDDEEELDDLPALEDDKEKD